MIEVVTILSVYLSDDASRLKTALMSLDNQSYRNHHVVIGVDGRIGDALSLVLKSFENNSRFTVIRFAENRGLAFVLNELICYVGAQKSLNTAKYIARMDADDESLPERFSLMIKFLDNNPGVDVAGSQSFDVDETGNIIYVKKMPQSRDDILSYFFLRSPLIHPSVFFRSSVLLRGGMRYPTGSFLTEDLMMWSLLLSKGYVLSNLDTPLIKFTVSNDTYQRRNQYPKAVSELKARVFLLKRIDIKKFKYCMYIIVAFLFKLLPVKLVKLLNYYIKKSL